MTTRTLTTKRGKTVETCLSDDEARRIVREAIIDGSLTSGFAKDLIERWDRWNRLSADQMIWVHVFANELLGDKDEDKAETEAIELPRIVEILRGARNAGLKYPKVRLETDDGQKVVLSIAGARAKIPGSVNITDGRRYGENIWFGRIEPGGALRQGRAMTGAVRDLLIAFDQDPTGTAKVQGALTDNCCFCGRDLETKESVGAGYGPVCAEKWGLPWGAETAARYEARKEAATRGNETCVDLDELVASVS